MSQSSTLFLGMDVHKDTIAVASVAHDHGAEVTSLGTIGTRQCESEQRIRKMPSKATHLIFVSAAGPCGDWLSRYLRKKDDDGWVVAPSRMPHKAGDRVTTDRRDARPLARLARAGALTVVSGPQVQDAARRDLTRARADAIRALTDAPCRLKAFVLRPALRSTGRANGGPAHLRWLSAGVCPTPTPPMVFPADVRAGQEHTARRQRLEQARHEPVHAWRLSPVGEALQAVRGVPCTVAVTLRADMGDRTRCDPPRALRPCLGLTPSAYASGAQRRQGAMTTAGHTQARRVRVAGAWASRSPATGRRHVPRRRATPPPIIQDSRWQAPVRRCHRSRRRVARGQHATMVTGALARALAGCRWASAREVPSRPSAR
jgi:transposase